MPRPRLAGGPWSLEPPAVEALMAKLRQVGKPLKEYAQASPLLGIKTGLNEAFLIDTPTKDALLKEDARCGELLRPYVRGQDIDRWRAQWAGLWMIVLKSSGDHAWPWADASEQAEEVFARIYPAIHRHLSQHREALIKRQDQGRYWWELRSCAYWYKFDQPRIIYQEIQFHPAYALVDGGLLGNNKTFFIPAHDLYLLAVLNSPLLWWFNWRHLPHMKDEALTSQAFRVEEIPIATPSPQLRQQVEGHTRRLLTIADQIQHSRRDVLDWLRVEYEIAKPSQKLQTPAGLDAESFIAEVRKLRGRSKPLSPAALRTLREGYAQSVEPMKSLMTETITLEGQLDDAVNQGFGLTPQEIALMWQTAPPRMPIVLR